MFYPHYCQLTKFSSGFDANRNPIVLEESSTKVQCRLEENLPNNPIFTPDGQTVPAPAGVIFIGRENLDSRSISIGAKIAVFESHSGAEIFSGTVKSFKADLFHIRIWV